ncbi:MAG: hypothetical protein JO257_08175, partial [Deltaproteobacteria bacterium]|nr:hypothetical protein [Deltaproteobacteria bacterium]
ELGLRIERGDDCYVGWVGKDVAHYSWVQHRGIHPITSAGTSVEIAPATFWIYNCHTAHAHRGRRLYPRTLQRIANESFAAGATEGWIYTSADNVASQHGVFRAGFQVVDTLRALRVGQHYRALNRDDAMNAA